MDTLILDCGTDIKGECTLDSYKEKIVINGFDHGVSMACEKDRGAAKRNDGKPDHDDFTVHKDFDLASCKLIEFCNKGTKLATVKVYICQTVDGKVSPYLTYELGNVVIASVTTQGGMGRPTESVKLNYSNVAWTYKPQVTTGDLKGQDATNFDLATNEFKKKS